MSAFLYRYAFIAILGGSLPACSARNRASRIIPATLRRTQLPPGGRGVGPPTPERELARLTRTLVLTEAQKAPILAVLEERQTKTEALKQSGSDRAAFAGNRLPPAAARRSRAR